MTLRESLQKILIMDTINSSYFKQIQKICNSERKIAVISPFTETFNDSSNLDTKSTPEKPDSYINDFERTTANNLKHNSKLENSNNKYFFKSLERDTFQSKQHCPKKIRSNSLNCLGHSSFQTKNFYSSQLLSEKKKFRNNFFFENSPDALNNFKNEILSIKFLKTFENIKKKKYLNDFVEDKNINYKIKIMNSQTIKSFLSTYSFKDIKKLRKYLSYFIKVKTYFHKTFGYVDYDKIFKCCSPYFNPTLNQFSSEVKLESKKSGTFLVRPSSRGVGFVLSFVSNNKVVSIRLDNFYNLKYSLIVSKYLSLNQDLMSYYEMYNNLYLFENSHKLKKMSKYEEGPSDRDIYCSFDIFYSFIDPDSKKNRVLFPIYIVFPSEFQVMLDCDKKEKETMHKFKSVQNLIHHCQHDRNKRQIFWKISKKDKKSISLEIPFISRVHTLRDLALFSFSKSENFEKSLINILI